MGPVLSELLTFKTATHGFRELRRDDAPQLFHKLFGVPEVVKYLPVLQHKSVSDSAKMIERYRQLAANDTVHSLVIVDREQPDELLGLLGVSVYLHTVALNIELVRDRRVLGMGRRFGLPFTRWLLAHANVWRCWSYCDAEHKEAIALNQRSGGTCEGLARSYSVHPNVSPWPRDCFIYAMVKGSVASTQRDRTSQPLPGQTL
jgi:RimJ/RimL family protein N-acetyltransferase